jgi:hypothetical protein
MKRPEGLTIGAQAKHPYFITQSRILPDQVARSVRTKKDRTSRAKLATRG